MTYSGIHHAISCGTREAIGVALSPHCFRYAAATTAAWMGAGMPELAAGLLQHQDPRVTEAHYIRATSFEAARQYGAMLRSQ
ncbi:hypothetical protein CR492_07275 [Methylocella silvestris]|uniref:Tyr recombinase domain-containing protein n=2 Tax=Methylocella silvestris TaxID=199596 RepID=A0A2J7TJ32_METSI|nr:hypothetical protein CR492_07275 [Methylocella silvestris]